MGVLFVEPRRWFSLRELQVGADLARLELCGEQLALAGQLSQPLELELSSGDRQWHWPLQPGEAGSWSFSGELAAAELGEELLLSLRRGSLVRPWVAIRVLRATPAELEQWRAFFAGEAGALPEAELERISHCALLGTAVQRGGDRPEAVAALCERAASQELVVEAAGLRHQGQFPSVLGQGPGRILASRLVLNWNLLLVQEGEQRFVVFQGVSSSDAVLLPGLNLLLLVCHVEAGTVRTCLAILSRTPEFFRPSQPARFGGYLVGHSRPYHCFYDGLLALQAVREAHQLTADDALYSKEGEAFVDLGRCLELAQPHQQLSQEALNGLTGRDGTYCEKIAIGAAIVAKKPAALSHVDATALALTGLTAIRAVDDTLKLKAGETILIQGGAGGVAAFAIQLAKHLGARVITTASAANHAYLSELGADQIIDYKATDFTKVVSNVDAVFDTVGGDVAIQSFEVLKPGGRAAFIASGPQAPKPDRGDVISLRPAVGRDRPALERIAELVRTGAVKVPPVRLFKLSDAVEAVGISKARHLKGKLVFKVK